MLLEVLVYGCLDGEALPLVAHRSLQALELLDEHCVECVEVLCQLSKLLVLLELVLLLVPLLCSFLLEKLGLEGLLLLVGAHCGDADNFLASLLLLSLLDLRLVFVIHCLEAHLSHIFSDIWLDSVDSRHVFCVREVKGRLLKFWA